MTSFDLKWPRVKLKVSIQLYIIRASKRSSTMTHTCISHPARHFMGKLKIWPRLTQIWPFVIKDLVRHSLIHFLSLWVNEIRLGQIWALQACPVFGSKILFIFWWFLDSETFFIIIAPHALLDGGIRFPLYMRKSFGVSLIIESPKLILLKNYIFLIFLSLT